MAFDRKNFIARRVAQEMRPGDIVNLGIGLPQRVPGFLPAGSSVVVQGENGILDFGPPASVADVDTDYFDAGVTFVTLKLGTSFMDSADSFALVRGGHIDATVLGALQVDEEGNLANWMVPDKMIAGFGGAVDLVTCARKVIVAMEHTNNGNPKIFKRCSYPLTGVRCVNLIVTDMAVIEVTRQGLLATEIAEGLTREDVINATEAPLEFANNPKVMTRQ
ncbi:MAG: 3-oxoacid CoA-transferase subunit B [Roseiarcus sp.]|jgi:acetate CoA/acetoacetate CoA-transferase beta subunit